MEWASTMERLTHSRQACFKECRYKHELAYELGLRPISNARALRMGSAYAAGQEMLGKGHNITTACAKVYQAYGLGVPEWMTPYEWSIEMETILRLLCAYEWRWVDSGIENIAAEFEFTLPLVNPATGRPTPSFMLGGKIDGIVRLEDGRQAVKESKLLGEDIGPDASLWRRLRIDSQISLYMHAARKKGFPVDTVLYDVTRKPAIAPEQVPILDGDGIKIILDKSGERVRTKDVKKWRQTASTEDGFVLQSRPMTVEEWGEKLTKDICERPAFYFQRMEVARLDQDIEDYQTELWDVQRILREAQLSGRWYKTVSRSCVYCPYFSICADKTPVSREAPPPPGFEFVSNVHPELTQIGELNVINASSATAETETCAASGQ